MTLRLRLALWHGTLTSLIVAIVCGYSFAVHARAHYDEADAVVQGAAAHAMQELRDARSSGDTLRALQRTRPLGVRIDLLGPAERTVSASSAPFPLSRLALEAAPVDRPYSGLARLAPALHASSGPREPLLTLPGAGGRWRVNLARDGDSLRVAVVSLPLAAIDRSVESFGRLMALLALLGGGMTFLLGWLVAGHALRPVATLTHTAEDIARLREFSRRVPERRSRDELATLARTFNEMLGSLEETYRAQQRFVADASHELRAPLTVIQANLELLHRVDALPPEERVRAVCEAHEEAGRLARLVTDLLALARADAGVPIRRGPLELDRVLLDVVGEARHLTTGQVLEIGPIEPILIDGDVDRMRQLLLILIDNAIRYTPPSGRVTVSLRDHGSAVEVEVLDEGVGISAEDLPRVFERFYRTDPARSRAPGGSGLGLPIASWIAERHGGRVILSSGIGRGTRAVVRLPARPRATSR